jgi:hypothetical protein
VDGVNVLHRFILSAEHQSRRILFPLLVQPPLLPLRCCHFQLHTERLSHTEPFAKGRRA